MKENVSEFKFAIDKISKLRGVNYEWIEDSEHNFMNMSGKDSGFIAQEVMDVIPELTMMVPGTETYTVNYAKMTAVLIAALREQREIVKECSDKLEIIKFNRSK